MLINHKLDFSQLINYACAPCAAKAQAAQAASAVLIENGWAKPQWSSFMSYPFLITIPDQLAAGLQINPVITVTSKNQFIQIGVLNWIRSDPRYSPLLI